MSNAAMNDPQDPSVPEPDLPRSSFRKRALILLYLLALGTAMAGWLWFLGWLSWRVIAWALGETP
jgi:hypothetical protein